MTTPSVHTISEACSAHGGQEVYHLPTDMFVRLLSVDSKSFATISHPLHGIIVVPCNELRN